MAQRSIRRVHEDLEFESAAVILLVPLEEEPELQDEHLAKAELGRLACEWLARVFANVCVIVILYDQVPKAQVAVCLTQVNVYFREE